MAISSYGELKATVSTHLFHQRFITEYDNATIKFEAAANRRLRVRQMEASTTLATASGLVALPSDYLAWRTVLWTGSTPYMELDYVHPAYLDSTNAGRDGTPKLFTIEGPLFKVRPVDDTTNYEFHYYQSIPTLTGADANSNWLLAAYPDVYVEGLLTEEFVLGRNMEQAQLHKQRRDELLAEIIQLSALTTGATSPQVRVAEFF